MADRLPGTADVRPHSNDDTSSQLRASGPSTTHSIGPVSQLDRTRNAQQNQPAPTASSNAADQYRILANHLSHAHSAGLLEDGGFDDDRLSTAQDTAEGIPIANTFLNLYPDVPESDVPEQSELGISEVDHALQFANDVVLGSPSQEPGRGQRSRRGRGYKWALKGTAHDPKLDRQASGRPRGRPRGSGQVRGRRKKALDPGQDFKTKQGKATRALIDGNFEEALESAREAVQANPEIWAAHALLAEALQALGREEDSLAALLSGAVVARDPNTWVMVAERTLDLAGEERSTESLQQALFCYSQAIDLEKPPERNISARFCKMNIWLELGEYSKARRDCKQLANFLPDDVDLARQLAELCAMTGDLYETSTARKTYEKALDRTFPPDRDISGSELDMAWGHLNVLIELVDRVTPPQETIMTLKRWARRFLGRSHEVFWDACQEDDREFDSDHVRRLEVEQFTAASASHDLARFGDGLPLELRVKLGLYRLKTTGADLDEAMQHLSQLLQYRDEIGSLYETFYIVATALQSKGETDAAIEFYEPILQIEDVTTNEFWLRYGRCLSSVARFEDAADCFKQVIELSPDHIDARVELARLYQNDLKDPEKAYVIVDEIIALNKRDLVRREDLLARPGQRRIITQQRNTAGRDSSGSDFGDGEIDEAAGDDHDRPVRPRKRARTDLDARSRLEAKDRRAQRRLLRAQEQAELKREKQKARAERHTAKVRNRLMMETMTEQVNDNFEIIKQHWPALDIGLDEEAIEEWTEAAMSLYEAFRGVKQFYPTRDKHLKFRGFDRVESREAKFMNEMESWRRELEIKSSEQSSRRRDAGGEKDFAEMYHAPPQPDENLPKDFCGISFTEWHHVFVDLALLFARRTDQTACYEVIDEGLYGANVFYHDDELLNTTQATSLSCAFIFNDNERLCLAARWFINRSDYREGSGFQLLSAANRLSYGNNMWFSAGPTQKHMLRVIKSMDYHAFDLQTRKRFDWGMQGPGMINRIQRVGVPFGELDTNALLTYGHMVGVANHSQSALPYFFRALAIQPENATINLSIAVMYVQNAMKRQTDNRQFGIAQGLSFLHRYRDFRLASGGIAEQQEVAYNIGRMWHMLGLTHLAVPLYEEALALSPAVQKEFAEKHPNAHHTAEDFSKEAAFALVNMLAVAGNNAAAKKLVEQHLILE